MSTTLLAYGLAALALLLAPVIGHAAPAAVRSAQEQERSDALADLEHSDPERVRAAWSKLAATGAASGPALLVDFSQASIQGRRLRVRLLIEVADARALPGAIENAHDPDAVVRRLLIEYLVRPDHGEAQATLRLAALEGMAAGDPDPLVRATAVNGLGDVDLEGAPSVLAKLCLTLPAREAERAASRIPPVASAWEAVYTLVSQGLKPLGAREQGARPRNAVLAHLLPLYGRLLADRPAGGEKARERAPLILALRHPDPAVERGAVEAFARLLARLRELGEADRAWRVLDGLGEQGLDHRLVQYQQARLAFYPGADPAAALEAARAMQGARTRGSDPDDRVWLFRSLYMEGMALVGLGRAAEGRPILREAGAVLDGILAERYDLRDESQHVRQGQALEQRAMVEISLYVAALLLGEAPEQIVLLEGLRRAHILVLEAQLNAARTRGQAVNSWDALMDSELSPYRLLFAGVDLPGITVERSLALQRQLGRGLATIAPVEVPGLRPYAEGVTGLTQNLSDPLSDPRRRDLLVAIEEARLDALEGDREELRRRIMLTRIENPGLVPQNRQVEMMRILEIRIYELRKVLIALEEDDFEPLLELRMPSSLALWLARNLREEGRTADARAVAGAMRDDLEATEFFRKYFAGLERLAQIEVTIGSSWTDEDEPRKAEEELLRAVKRLEGIEQSMLDAGALPAQLAPVRAIRAGALVSLAVNANVKLLDPERALEFYEQAYELRQDDFMRVLLACYRARSGRAEEARRLLRVVRPGPQVYYNMACTYALLGDTARALEFLERELLENHPGEGSRERQKDWAGKDPDLASLRQDPRFQRLVGQ